MQLLLSKQALPQRECILPHEQAFGLRKPLLPAYGSGQSLACPVQKAMPPVRPMHGPSVTSVARQTTCSRPPTLPVLQAAVPQHGVPACVQQCSFHRAKSEKTYITERTRGTTIPSSTWISRWLCLKGCIACSTLREPRHARPNYRGVTRIPVQTCRRSQVRREYTALFLRWESQGRIWPNCGHVKVMLHPGPGASTMWCNCGKACSLPQFDCDAAHRSHCHGF